MTITTARHSVRGVSPVVVGIVALVIAAAFVVRNLVPVGWDMTIFTAFGAEDTDTLAYGEALLGEVEARSHLGHDGRFFFIQANDPWYLEPGSHAAYLDRPLYRAQRMLYPTLAGGFGLFSPEVIVWSMVLVNVAALALGTVVTASVARAMGGSAWWGLAFALNVGLLNELLVGGAGVLGLLCVMLAVSAVQKESLGWALGALVGAVLSREVLLLSAVGIAWWLWRKGQQKWAVAFFVVPLGAIAMWGAYLRLRLGGGGGIDQVQELGLPFSGFVEAVELWRTEPVGLAIGVAVLFLLFLTARRTVRDGWLIGWATIGFVPLTLLLTRQVWFNYYDITRAVAPIITAFLLMVFSARPDHVGIVEQQSPWPSPPSRDDITP